MLLASLSILSFLELESREHIWARRALVFRRYISPKAPPKVSNVKTRALAHQIFKEETFQLRMAKSLAKVQKKVAKKKGKSNSLHENSRDAQRLRRAGARSEKLDRLAAGRAKANQTHCPKILSRYLHEA